MSDLPEIESAEELARGKFLKFSLLRWRDAEGAQRQWETVTRTDDHGAVLIIPWLRPSNRLVVIRQYRPPADRFVYEFPAGLIDAGETPEQAARRELKEETGCTANTMTIGSNCYTTPGMSNESVYMAQAEIDEHAPENLHPETDFDPSENIETLFIPRADLQTFHRTPPAPGTGFDSKLAAYILALELRSTIFT